MSELQDKVLKAIELITPDTWARNSAEAARPGWYCYATALGTALTGGPNVGVDKAMYLAIGLTPTGNCDEVFRWNDTVAANVEEVHAAIRRVAALLQEDGCS